MLISKIQLVFGWMLLTNTEILTENSHKFEFKNFRFGITVTNCRYT